MVKSKLLIISLDAISNSDLALLKQSPIFNNLCREGSVVTDVSPVFVSNTYPIHTSVITGCYPSKHGIYDNVKPIPGDKNPEWFWFSKDIKIQTLYDAATKAGLVTASMFWPVTAGAKIKYNIPEILPTKPRENQITLSLKNGSPLFTLKSALKFGKRLKGPSQPALDDFSCNVMCDVIKRKEPDLMLIHFTDADSQKHNFGVGSNEANESILRMNYRIDKLLTALSSSTCYDNYHIIIFSDHGMSNVQKSVDPNASIEDEGLIKYSPTRNVLSWKAWMKGCGGSAFCYLNKDYLNVLNESQKVDFQNSIRNIFITEFENKEGVFSGFINEKEFIESGLNSECLFGVSAKPGIELINNNEKSHMANHGYSLESGEYNTFYIALGPKIKKNFKITGGSLLEIAPLACHLLNIPIWEMDGHTRKEILL